MMKVARYVWPALAMVMPVAPGVAQAADPAPITGRDARSRALYLALIEDLRKSGKAHAALAHLDAFDRQFPSAADAAILRGDCLVDLQDYGQAAAIYRSLLKGPAAPAAHAGLGRVAALGDRWAEAAEHYAGAVALAPTSAAYLNDYGFALLNAGRPADAVFRLRQAAELAPSDARVRGNLVLALAADGKEAEARGLLAGLPDRVQRAELEAELAARRPGPR